MENLGIDGKLLLAQIVNFILFFIIFKKFVAKPFATFLNEEAKKEKEKQRIMEEIKKSEEKFLIDQEDLKSKMRQEMDEAVRKAKETAEKVHEDIISSARKEAEQVVAKGRKQIEEEAAALQNDMKNKVSKLSIFIIEHALRDYLDEETRSRLTGHILKNLNRAITSHEN